MRDDLLRIWQAGKTLLTDIDLIVEWAKWDSGQISGGRGPVDLVDILDAALVTAASQLAEAGRSLSWPEDAGTGVQCDGDLLARVITDWLDYLIASSEGTVFCTVNPDASTVQIILTASLGQRAWEEVAWASAPYQMGGRVPGVEWLKTGVTLQRDRAILVAMGGTLDVGEREGSMALTIRLPRAM
jgi:K+-sensing histidine kinase KdpD